MPWGPTEAAPSVAPTCVPHPSLPLLQPYWSSFCCLNTQTPSHFRALCLLFPLVPLVTNHVPDLLTDGILCCSRFNLQGTFLRGLPWLADRISTSLLILSYPASFCHHLKWSCPFIYYFKKMSVSPCSLPCLYPYISRLGTGTLAILFTTVSSAHGPQYPIVFE